LDFSFGFGFSDLDGRFRFFQVLDLGVNFLVFRLDLVDSVFSGFGFFRFGFELYALCILL